MRVPNLDPPDDAPPPDARESSEEPAIVDMSEWPADRNPLEAFAVEQSSRPRPSAHPSRFELLPAQMERPERFERFERLERFERFERFGRFGRLAAVLAIAAVVVIAVVTWDRPRDQDLVSSSAGQRLEPARSATGGTVNVAVPTTDVPVLESAKVSPQKQPPRVADARPARPEPRSPIVKQPPRSVALTPARPQPQLEPQRVPTTGVAPATETAALESPALAPVVSAVGSVVAAPAPPAAPIPAAPAPPPAAVARAIAPRAAVESVLSRYAGAFSSLDAQGAKAVWPGVNERNLQRAFENLEEQAFDLGSCDITVLPPRALAQCSGTARYTPKLGNRRERSESRRWTFRLVQNEQDWSIESVESR